MSTNSMNYIDPSSVINTTIFDSIRDMATCVFCTGVAINPKQCNKCENCFCNICVTKWKEKSNDCPYKCGELIISEPSRVIKNILNKILFRCPKNCKKEVNYEELIKHVTNCKNKIIDCPTCGCKVSEDKIEKKSYFEIKIENEILKAKIAQVQKELRQIERDKKEAELRDPQAAKRLNEINMKSYVVPSYYGDDRANNISANNMNNQLKNITLNSGANKREMININKLIPPGEESSFGLQLSQNKIDPKNISNINFEIHDNSVRFSYKFSCCSKYYDCVPCHNIAESHANSKIVSIACYECLAMTNYIDESFCDNCGNSFQKENTVSIDQNKSNRAEDIISIYAGVKEASAEDIFSKEKNKSIKHAGEYGRNDWDKAQFPGVALSNDINNLFAQEISKISKGSMKKPVMSKACKPKSKRGDGNYFFDS